MQAFGGMIPVKDTLRATVQVSFDGRVFKTYHGPNAQERFDQEIRVLRFLEARGCGFVPESQPLRGKGKKKARNGAWPLRAFSLSSGLDFTPCSGAPPLENKFQTELYVAWAASPDHGVGRGHVRSSIGSAE